MMANMNGSGHFFVLVPSFSSCTFNRVYTVPPHTE
jgi:hypothetical protein